MENNIELRPCIGVVVGTERNPEPTLVEWDQDEIWCNGRRIGHVSHAPGSIPRIHRVLTERTKAEILARVRKLREESGGAAVGDEVASLPEPSTIRKALNSSKRK